MTNLIFVHVPKCAGTSVIIALKSVYGKQMWVDRSFRRYRGEKRGWQWQSRLPLEPSNLFPQNTTCITGNFTWMKWNALGWRKIVFLREPYARAVSQYSVRGHREAATFMEFVRTGENSISRMVGDLRQYLFVGLQEHFDESMEMLEWYVGIKFARPIPFRNFRRVPVYEPTEGERSDFLKLNGLDLDLYKEAKKVFNRQREEYSVGKTKAKA